MNLKQWLTKQDQTTVGIANRLGIPVTTLRRWTETGVPVTRRNDVIAVSDGEVKFPEDIPKPIEMLLLCKEAILQLEDMQVWTEGAFERQQIQWVLNDLYKLMEHIKR